MESFFNRHIKVRRYGAFADGSHLCVQFNKGINGGVGPYFRFLAELLCHIQSTSCVFGGSNSRNITPISQKSTIENNHNSFIDESSKHEKAPYGHSDLEKSDKVDSEQEVYEDNFVERNYFIDEEQD